MSTQSEPYRLDPDSEVPSDAPMVELPRPDLRGASFGSFGEVLKMWRHHKKREKLANKGYVQWYLIDDAYPRAVFVKPKQKGGGIPELKHKGERYLFPRSSMVPNESQGLWTVMHKRGEADPINIRDPSKNSIKTDALEEYLSMRVSSSPPGMFDNFDFDVADLIKYAMIGIVFLAIMQGVMGGGLI